MSLGMGEKRPLAQSFVNTAYRKRLTSPALTADDEQNVLKFTIKNLISPGQVIYCPIMSLSFQYRVHKAKPDISYPHSHTKSV
jgi:hypothetical protein